jgi:hypothetical protein
VVPFHRSNSRGILPRYIAPRRLLPIPFVEVDRTIDARISKRAPTLSLPMSMDVQKLYIKCRLSLSVVPSHRRANQLGYRRANQRVPPAETQRDPRRENQRLPPRSQRQVPISPPLRPCRPDCHARETTLVREKISCKRDAQHNASLKPTLSASAEQAGDAVDAHCNIASTADQSTCYPVSCLLFGSGLIVCTCFLYDKVQGTLPSAAKWLVGIAAVVMLWPLDILLLLQFCNIDD